MPPEIQKAFSAKLLLSENVLVWLNREAEAHGIDKSRYITFVLESLYKGGKLNRRAGTDMEVCNLLYNNLQALYMFRRNLSEKNQDEIVEYCEKAMEPMSLARDYLTRRYVGLDSIQAEELLRIIQISTELLQLAVLKTSDRELIKKMKKSIAENEETVKIYSDILRKKGVKNG